VRHVVTTIAERLGKRLEEVARDVAERPGQDAAYVIDSSKARAELGWQPRIPFTQGIDDVVKWVEEYWPEIEKQPLAYQHQP